MCVKKANSMSGKWRFPRFPSSNDPTATHRALSNAVSCLYRWTQTQGTVSKCVRASRDLSTANISFEFTWGSSKSVTNSLTQKRARKPNELHQDTSPLEVACRCFAFFSSRRRTGLRCRHESHIAGKYTPCGADCAFGVLCQAILDNFVCPPISSFTRNQGEMGDRIGCCFCRNWRYSSREFFSSFCVYRPHLNMIRNPGSSDDLNRFWLIDKWNDVIRSSI